MVDFDGSVTIRSLQSFEVLVDLKSTATDYQNHTIKLSQGLSLASFDTAEYVSTANNAKSNLVGSLSSATLTIQNAGLSMARTDGFAATRTVINDSSNVAVFTATLTNTSDTPVKVTQLTFANVATPKFDGNVTLRLRGTGIDMSKEMRVADAYKATFNSLDINLVKGTPVIVTMTADFQA